MSGYLGFDTSNYTTSVAFYNGSEIIQQKRLLPVKEGERGIRQSDAVFHHTKAYPELLEKLMAEINCGIKAVGASTRPTTQEGSYMPCFLVGEGVARGIAAAMGIKLHSFSHQQGHIAAALYSAGKTELVNDRFLAFHVSGGTTDLVLCEPCSEKVIKTTLYASSSDLKAGQAIDRIGVKMGVSFPAGKGVEELALASSRAFKNKVKLKDGFCSLSGLENKCLKMLSDGESHEDTARFLLDYVADVVLAMTENALSALGEMPVVYAGGVMSDVIICEKIQPKLEAYFAEPDFSCDNAAGIAYLTSVIEG
ncbi:MAG: peptidase M22 [Clostridia bacterium]|nr:peptidase M22 [Clostridia bacterium]